MTDEINDYVAMLEHQQKCEICRRRLNELHASKRIAEIMEAGLRECWKESKQEPKKG